MYIPRDTYGGNIYTMLYIYKEKIYTVLFKYGENIYIVKIYSQYNASKVKCIHVREYIRWSVYMVECTYIQ